MVCGVGKVSEDDGATLPLEDAASCRMEASPVEGD
jgi:hypothetical protein